MKLSQDLYDAGILRRQRMGPSDDWGFDDPDASLKRTIVSVWTLLRRPFVKQRRRATGRQQRHFRNPQSF